MRHFKYHLKLPIENYVLDYFVIPSLPLRISSGLQLRTAPKRLFCHSALFLVILSDSEESPQETLRLCLRVTEKGHSFASAASAQDSASGRLAPQNDGMREKPPFSIGNFRISPTASSSS